ncbi:MAG TPA: FAD/NAD(P)-binding oxidoreductase, partial [Gemmatimonadaceae bacterium]|nr:FAD/NAD(P)-binding oxidoreductase [Gemmatimonadaceae bacterium]
ADVHHGAAVVDAVAPASADAPFIVVAERHRGGPAIVVHARTVVLATGARERFLPFPGWTLPGVVGIGGAQALLKQGAEFTGRRVVIAGTGPLMLPVAASLSGAGARVVLVAEQAPAAAVRDFAMSLIWQPEALAQAALYRLAFLGAPYQLGTWVTEAVGGERVESVTVSSGGRTRRVACDVLCTGYGLVPNVELARLLGCAVADGAVAVSESQETTIPRVFAAGEATGIGGVALSLVEGEIAGAAAAGAIRPDSALARRRASLQRFARALARTFAPRAELRALVRDETIVCRCEDVARRSVMALGDARQAKLYTRAGMGACQGRVCGPALEFLFGWAPGTVRPPAEPARLGTLTVAGLSLAPAGLTPTSNISSGS